MSIHADEALVLGTSPYSNTSLIATFFSRREGKVRVVARGARSPKSRMGVSLEPATRVHAEWSMGAGRDLGTLRRCETLSVFHNLWKDMEGIELAGRLLRAVDRLFGVHEGEEKNFGLLLAALEAVDAGGDLGSIEALYLAGMLGQLGIAPGLTYCASCDKKPGGERAALDIAAGELRCSRCELPAGQAVRLKAGSVVALRDAMVLDTAQTRSIRIHRSLQEEIASAARALISFHMGVSLPAKARQAH